MTTQNPTADTGAGRAALGSRSFAVARLTSSRALVSLLWATGVMALLTVVALLVARWQGWDVAGESGVPGLAVEGESVTLSWTVLWIPVGVAVATVAMAAVLSAMLTRPLISTGATRREVALGMLTMCLVMLLHLALVTAVSLAISGPGSARSFVDQSHLGGAELAVGAALGVLSAMLLALVVVTLFQRWRWWVGTAVLIVLFTVMPLFQGAPIAFALTGLGVGWEALRSAVLVAAYWLMLRRLPVP